MSFYSLYQDLKKVTTRQNKKALLRVYSKTTTDGNLLLLC